MLPAGRVALHYEDERVMQMVRDIARFAQKKALEGGLAGIHLRRTGNHVLSGLEKPGRFFVPKIVDKGQAAAIIEWEPRLPWRRTFSGQARRCARTPPSKADR